MKFRDSQPSETAELELAPMIDVVFLLLIFFIVSWQFAKFEEDMDISVPAAEDKAPEDTVGEIIVNVESDGTVILNKREVSLSDLYTKLSTIVAAAPGQSVILRGHEDSTHQQIIEVLDRVKKAGIKNIAFAMKSEKK